MTEGLSEEAKSFRRLYAAITICRYLRNRFGDLLLITVFWWFLAIVPNVPDLGLVTVLSVGFVHHLLQGLVHWLSRRLGEHEIARFALQHSERKRQLRLLLRAMRWECVTSERALRRAELSIVRFIVTISVCAGMIFFLPPGPWLRVLFWLFVLFAVAKVVATLIQVVRMRIRAALLLGRATQRFLAA